MVELVEAGADLGAVVIRQVPAVITELARFPRLHLPQAPAQLPGLAVVEPTFVESLADFAPDVGDLAAELRIVLESVAVAAARVVAIAAVASIATPALGGGGQRRGGEGDGREAENEAFHDRLHWAAGSPPTWRVQH